MIAKDVALEDNIHFAVDKPTPFDWRLRIRSAQVADEGIYECYVMVTLNAMLSDRRTLAVHCMNRAIGYFFYFFRYMAICTAMLRAFLVITPIQSVHCVKPTWARLSDWWETSTVNCVEHVV